MPTVVRKGVCLICGKHGITNIHHRQYDESDPLAHTIEVCPSCHRKEHWSTDAVLPKRDIITGRFLKS